MPIIKKLNDKAAIVTSSDAELGTAHVIQDEGVSLTQRSKLNFEGAGVTVTDDGANDETTVTIPGGGSSGGTSDLLPAEGFNLVMFENFENNITSSLSTIDDSLTTGTYVSASGGVKLECDKTPTFSSSGTTITLSGAPSFTMVANDIIYADGEWRRISSVTTQTEVIVDVAFSNTLSAESGMVSQAIYTEDLVNFGDAAEETRARDLYPSTDIESVSVSYFDSLADADTVPDYTEDARMVVSISNEGLQADTGLPDSDEFSSIFTRGTITDTVSEYTLSSNTNQERLFAVFFCNPNNASVTAEANLHEYRISFN